MSQEKPTWQQATSRAWFLYPCENDGNPEYLAYLVWQADDTWAIKQATVPYSPTSGSQVDSAAKNPETYAGPFPTLEAGKAAWVVLFGRRGDDG